MSSKRFSCVWLSDILCNYRKHPMNLVMDRCFKCEVYLGSLTRSLNEDKVRMDFEVKAKIDLLLKQDNDVIRRVSLNPEIVRNPYLLFPIINNGGHPEFSQVGRGSPTDEEWCSRWRGLDHCLNFDSAQHLAYGVGMAVFKHKHTWCHSPDCPVCFLRGYVVRSAKRATRRVMEGVKRGLGVPWHFMVSLSKSDYHLKFDEFIPTVVDALRDRGVFAFAQLFHGFRIDGFAGGLVYSPHVHPCGFANMERCSKCRHDKNCFSCHGFFGREARGYKKDGIIVKAIRVLPTEGDVFRVFHYQLSHATLKQSAFRRFFAIRYFGKLSNRQFKSGAVVSERKCVLCGEDMTACIYTGKRHVCKDRFSKEYEDFWVESHIGEDGQPVSVDKIGSREVSF